MLKKKGNLCSYVHNLLTEKIRTRYNMIKNIQKKEMTTLSECDKMDMIEKTMEQETKVSVLE